MLDRLPSYQPSYSLNCKVQTICQFYYPPVISYP